MMGAFKLERDIVFRSGDLVGRLQILWELRIIAKLTEPNDTKVRIRQVL